MNPLLEELFNTSYSVTSKGDKVDHRIGSIDPGEAIFINELVAELKPSSTLEVGLGFGFSALAICDALLSTSDSKSSGKHIAIDPYQHSDLYRGVGLENLDKAGFGQMVHYYDAPSHKVLPLLEAQGTQIDFAFIDGWHTFDYVLVDFFYIDKMLSDGGIIVFDDADWPSVRKVVRYVVTNCPYRVHRSLALSRNAHSQKRQIWDTFTRLTAFTADKIMRVRLFREVMVRTLDAEVLGVDGKVGLGGSCVAIQKYGTDTRKVNSHVQF